MLTLLAGSTDIVTMPSSSSDHIDIVLIGAGIMSATFAALIHELDPSRSITLFETLDGSGLESSHAWNNAGTGHAGYCELNYTPQQPDGSVEIAKALDINTEFDLSRQLWAHWVRSGQIPDPTYFIRTCPHISMVWGSNNVAFLRARHHAMSAHHCFAGMEYSEDPAVIAQWAPLAMAGRPISEPVAATRIMSGTDVDYGALTRTLLTGLQKSGAVTAHYQHRVTGLSRASDGRWHVTTKNTRSGKTVSVCANFVFVGAGGAALELLQKSAIPEAAHYGGFPVSGVWLQCTDPDVTRHHHAKVYGQAAVGSPPMSAPHLDTRVIDGQSYLLFGPYAGFSTKFLKRGSWTDFFRSLTVRNVLPTLTAGWDNLPLVRYLIGEIVQSRRAQFASLLKFYPTANPAQWKKMVAGQRVQIIKPDRHKRGVLKFGTEVVIDGDRSLVAVLGASPGASIAASIALRVVEKCFATHMSEDAWRTKLKVIFPTYGIDLRSDAQSCAQTRADTAKALQLHNA